MCKLKPLMQIFKELRPFVWLENALPVSSGKSLFYQGETSGRTRLGQQTEGQPQLLVVLRDHFSPSNIYMPEILSSKKLCF